MIIIYKHPVTSVYANLFRRAFGRLKGWLLPWKGEGI